MRRGRSLVGDIEIVAIPKRPCDLFGNPLLKQPTALDQFLAEKGVKFTKNGSKYKQFRYGRFTVDLFLPLPETWGSIYMIRTGSHEFNMWMIRFALGAGVRFKDGLLFDSRWQPIKAREEVDVFAALGLPFIPPDKRDERRWLELIG